VRSWRAIEGLLGDRRLADAKRLRKLLLRQFPRPPKLSQHHLLAKLVSLHGDAGACLG
jgi:hypothetical protein